MSTLNTTISSQSWTKLADTTDTDFLITWGVANSVMAVSAIAVGYGRGYMQASTVDNTTLTPASITTAVWSALATQYSVAGTMGNKLNSAASGGVDYAALGEAVWNVLLADANTTGSIGELVQGISGGVTPPTVEEIAAGVSAHASTLTVGKFLALKD